MGTRPTLAQNHKRLVSRRGCSRFARGSAGGEVQTSCQNDAVGTRGKGLLVHHCESAPSLSCVSLAVNESKAAPKARGRGAGASAARQVDARITLPYRKTLFPARPLTFDRADRRLEPQAALALSSSWLAAIDQASSSRTQERSYRMIMMLKTTPGMTPEERSERFKKDAQSMIGAGELNLTDADRALDAIVRRNGTKKGPPKRPQVLALVPKWAASPRPLD